MTTEKPTVGRFSDLNIAPVLLGILEKNNYTIPTPIQHQAIPALLEGKDLVGIAQTGTGKTLAFGLPMIQHLGKGEGQGLILVPTRELALQADEVLQKLGRSLGLKTVVVIGGAPMYRQIEALRRNPHVVIATPGRLIDHIQQKTFKLDKVKIIVLDEADRMFDIGFMPQIKQILAEAPTERQTMLFSATMPQEIAEIAARHMKMPIRVEVAPAGTSAENVEQEMILVRKEGKAELLQKLLRETEGNILVFSRTKHGAKKITDQVLDFGHTATEIHSNKSLAQRRMALDGFKSGRYRVLVATDIAARGIDVKNIALVINYDLPDNSEDYVHRIGRTGRAGNMGKAVSFATPDQRGNIKEIERLIRKTLPLLNPSGIAVANMEVSSSRSFGSGRRVNTAPRYGSREPRGRAYGEFKPRSQSSEDRPRADYKTRDTAPKAYHDRPGDSRSKVSYKSSDSKSKFGRKPNDGFVKNTDRRPKPSFGLNDFTSDFLVVSEPKKFDRYRPAEGVGGRKSFGAKPAGDRKPFARSAGKSYDKPYSPARKPYAKVAAKPAGRSVSKSFGRKKI
jgi:ATP-dependent RNA helicase RhlE